MANRVVMGLLRSPARGLMSGSTVVIRYVGRKSGKTFATPTQYAKAGDILIIMVGRPETKNWWRNFGESRDVDVLIDGDWVPMTGKAWAGADDPEQTSALLETYVQCFPRLARNLGGIESVVLVACQPR